MPVQKFPLGFLVIYQKSGRKGLQLQCQNFHSR